MQAALRLSRPSFSFMFAALIGALSFCAGGCSTVRPTSLVVPLVYHSKPATGAVALSGAAPRVCVLPVTDKRPVQDRIGENREKPAIPVPILPAGQSPAEFVHQAMVEELMHAGINVVESPEQADRTVAATLDTFWCAEDQDYQAQVSFTVQVQDKAGHILWNGKTAGDGHNWGKSLNPENYVESFNEAAMKAVEALLGIPGFQQALTAGAVTAPPPSANPLAP